MSSSPKSSSAHVTVNLSDFVANLSLKFKATVESDNKTLRLVHKFDVREIEIFIQFKEEK